MSSVTPQCYAHSLAGRPLEEWQGLEEHLIQTADLAESFASGYAPGWGRIAGLWHDAGKYRQAFQTMIGRDPDAHVSGTVDHSSVGALIAAERKASMLAFVVAGHHGGMQNADDLGGRLKEKLELLDEARRDGLPQWLEEQVLPRSPDWLADRAQLSLWTRFLFSALVDADFLDTEKFYSGGAGRDLAEQPGLAELKTRLDEYIARKAAASDQTPMNRMRSRVLDACRTKAALKPGTFTLTVPTGGGKTLASLAFALDHAVKHRLRRVIVVIPYTSIIEQTAAVYRDALGEHAVLEHHTNVDPDRETRTNRLASENWDSPVVVTTSVQFFESLYANRPARCRKLHRIAESVVVFDEVQTFPVKLLAPVRHVLQELAEHYRATTVFCTATQPMLLEGAREIVPEPEKEFAVVADRCEVLMPTTEEPLSWESLAAELKDHERVLAIVHRRDDAQHLADLVGEECLHLSARMCAMHRSKVLIEVKRRLESRSRCRLVATQLVEAGVDLDFPEVFRAFAGADSLAQAAGRCNREGKGLGRLHVFVGPSKPPRGILRTAEAEAKTMWRLGELDLKSPATFTQYFARLYGRAEQDTRGVMAAEREQRFKDVAEQFRIIDEAGQPVVAPYGDWQQRVEDVRRIGISRDRMRRLQPFMVTLYNQEIDLLAKAGAIERIEDTFWAVVPGFRVYSDRWGFAWKGLVAAEPEDLIA
jgi:CRISPR-associated endonuclease/helicase Cas3